MKNSKVTIGIPVYNGEKYISEALDSILKQTRAVDEIVISENHSTDRTPEILQQFSKDHPEYQVRIQRTTKTIDVDENFNKCIEMCSGDYLILLGADDRLKPDTVEMHLQVFDQRPDLALVGGLFDTIDEEGKTVRSPKEEGLVIYEKGDIIKFMEYTGFYMQHSTIMFNMMCTREIGYFDKKAMGPDERFNVEHLVRYPIAQIRKGIVESRIHKGQVTNFERLRFKDKLLHFKANLEMAKYESTPKRRRELRNLINNWIASNCISIGRNISKNYGQNQLAMKYWLFGVRTKPDILFKTQLWRAIVLSLLNK